MGPGLKNGVIRSRRKNLPLKSSGFPSRQLPHTALTASTVSFIFGAGGSHFIPNLLSMCPFTWLPIPRMNLPSDALCSPQEV
jgi:hypothetical protein